MGWDWLSKQKDTCRSSLPEVLCEKTAWNIWKNLQENACTGDFLKLNLSQVDLPLLKKRLLHMCFPVNFLKLFRTAFL